MTTETPSTDLLTDLRSLWGSTGGDVATFAGSATDLPTGDTERGTDDTGGKVAALVAPRPIRARRRVRCVAHLQPFETVEQEDGRRPGWFRSTCRRCGSFLGYRRAG